MGASLTVGIPTYQRRDAVVQTTSALLTVHLPPGVDVLVIDDGSSDGTFDALQELAHPRLRVLRNDSNRRFFGTFARLFEESSSDYLLVTSDEDEVAVGNLPAYLAALDATRPLMASPQAIVDGKVNRGRSTQRRMHPREWRSASNYISGTTYQVPTSRPLVKRIAELAADNGAAEVYPQVLLTAELLLRGEGLWFPHPLTNQRHNLPTHITDKKHGTYFHVAGRWDQYLAFEAYLSGLVAAADTPEKVDAAKAMLDIHVAGLFGLLRGAVAEERPDLAAIFDVGARRAHRPKVLQRSTEVLRNPQRAFAAVRDRFAAWRATSSLE